MTYRASAILLATSLINPALAQTEADEFKLPSALDPIQDSSQAIQTPKILEKNLAHLQGALITGQHSIGFAFEVTESGPLTGLSVNLAVSAALANYVPMYFHIHSDNEGKIGRAFAQTSVEVSLYGDPKVSIELPVPPGVTLYKGDTYWLIADSPSGAEVLWLTEKNEKGRRLLKNIYNGEHNYTRAHLGLFEISTVSEPEENNQMSRVLDLGETTNG